MSELPADTSRECKAFFNEDGSFTGLKTTDFGTPSTFKVAEEYGSTALTGRVTFNGNPSFQKGAYDVKKGGEYGDDIIITIRDESKDQRRGPDIICGLRQQENSEMVKAEQGVGNLIYKAELPPRD
ncbi:hypothetical protein FRC12_017899 [Ceratobasidium sp. 428]|nr:hypothetical protein FRC12_017899 [Ceratobasidium sp. 428]